MIFAPIGDAIHDHFQGKKSMAKQVEAAMVVESAKEMLEEILGKDLARHAKPLFLKNRTLTITCSSSVVAQAVRLNQKAMVEKINEKLGKKEVDRIRYLA